jgi:hypothetical protein
MTSHVVALVIGAGVQWIIFTVLLWIMLKIFKLSYNGWGLLGSSLLAIAVTFIPMAGPYLSYPVLVFCLWKCTKADIAPDIVFTVAVSRAVLFCINLWILGGLMGNLRTDLKAEEKSPERSSQVAQAEESKPGDASAKAASPSKQPLGDGKSRGLSLKGVSLHETHPLVMIGAGSRIYTLTPGESAAMDAPEGKLQVRCEEISRSAVILSVNRGEKIFFRVQ